MFNTVRCIATLLTALLLVSVDPTRAQQVSGVITGYVTDPGGAAIGGAEVTITDVLTGVLNKTTTDPSGRYFAPNLIPGTYSVGVVAPGFRKFIRENVVLNVDAVISVDASLLLGVVSDTVTVTAAPPILNTQKTDVSATLSAEDVSSLPTIGRNITALEVLTPGVIQYNYQQGVSENPGNGFTANANGQFWGSNNYQLDGITDTQFALSGFQVVVPPADGVQEMKVTTADYDAELGQVSGMVVQYSTRSGTNSLHGSLWEFNQNSAFYAANPYTEKVAGTGPNGTGTGPSPYNSNTFGASLGGRIKKDKMFFFGDYQGGRTSQSSALLTTVPTAAFASGNLTAALGSKLCFNPSNSSSNGVCGGAFTAPLMVPTTEGGMIQAQQNMVFNPNTGNPDGSGREAFTVNGVPNMIPANAINPVSNNLLKLLNSNLKSGTLNQSLTNNNFAGVIPGDFNTDQYDSRYDWNISDRDRMFVRYTYFGALLNDPPIFGLAGGPSAIGSNGELAHYADQLAAINYTHSFGPNLLMEGRIGLTRFALTGYQSDVGQMTDTQVGILGINTASALTQGLAGITVSGPVGGLTMGDPSGQGLPRLNYETQFEWVNNWSKQFHNHELRWGIDVIRERENFLTVNESSRGNFQFNQLITADNGISGTGLGMGTFLLGAPSYFDLAVFTQLPAERDTRVAPYFQDNWHATKKLTLSLGLRYDYIGPSTPAFPGGGVNFDPGTGDLLLSGLGQVSNSADIKRNLKNFEPRIGFAYRVLSNTVMRAGFGRAYFSSNYGGGVFGTLCCSYPVQTREDISQVNSYFPIILPGESTNLVLNPNVPIPTVPAATLPNSGLLPLPPGLGAFYIPTHNPNSSVDSWNFTVEHQLSPNWVVSAAYVGNAGRHIYQSWDFNAPVPGPGDVNTRRPLNYLGIDTTVSERCDCANSSYNALQLVVKKQVSMGYSIQSNFTWSKALDQPFGGFSGGPLNPFDRNASYAPDNNNRAVVWTLAHQWTLPYGKGAHWGSSAGTVQQAVLGGWVFDGITTVMSGSPVFISWSDTSSLNNGGDYGQRPDIVGNPLQNIPAGRWYNPAAFANPGLYKFGDYDSGSIVGPMFESLNLSLWKEFRFRTPLAREDTTLQLRFEAFNALNGKNKAQPDGTANDSTAGLITGTLTPMRQLQFGVRMRW